MSKILVISGHPDYKNSLANRAILDEFHRLVPEADIVYLDAEYPCGSSSMCYYPRSCPNVPPDKTRAHEDASREDQSIPGLSAPDFTKYD